MEKRLIDADATLQIIDNYAKTVDGEHKEVIKAIRDIVEVISPTVNAVEVVHGEWRMGESGVVYFCSQCRCAAHPRESERWKYCPHCGAKMDGKVNE
jgi:hypothetical protein